MLVNKCTAVGPTATQSPLLACVEEIQCYCLQRRSRRQRTRRPRTADRGKKTSRTTSCTGLKDDCTAYISPVPNSLTLSPNKNATVFCNNSMDLRRQTRRVGQRVKLVDCMFMMALLLLLKAMVRMIMVMMMIMVFVGVGGCGGDNDDD